MQLLFLTFFILVLLPIDTVQATSIEIYGDEDTYVEEKFPTTAPWNNRNLYVGTDSWYGKGKTRILIRPDFNQLQERAIAPTDIESVDLILTAYEYEGTDSTVTIDAYTTTSPWSMFTATWNLQPSISSKKNSTLISPQPGEKSLTVTQAFIDAYKVFPVAENGILLKINAETEKAMIFWAHGCDIAPSPPICAGVEDRPHFRITYRNNLPPPSCRLKSPSLALTNSPTTKIEPLASTDPEGNTISYLGRICLTPDCATSVWQNALKIGESVSTDLPDGTYFASCLATDGYHAEEWGSIFSFDIDTTAPSAPQIIDEPPFTGSLSNTISWLPIAENGVTYQVLSSERSDFRSYNTYSSWTSENRLTIIHSKEKAYYFKVKAKDKAGNESLWSTSTSTIIDTAIPTIKYFKTNKTLVSPKVAKNGDLSENAYIQGGVDDQNIDELTLIVLNSGKKSVFSTKVEGKSYLWTHWPEKAGYPDDTYIVTLLAQDSVQNIIQSDPIFITIDTKPPPLPTIAGLTDKQVLTKQKFTISATCSPLTLATVYVSGKIVAYGKEKHVVTIAKTDGTYSISATCTDLASNKSTKNISFTIDTTPPAIPSLSYKFDKAKKQITLSSYCREAGAISFFQNGILLQTSNCKKNTNATYLLPETIQLPYYSVFNAKAQDTYGNTSSLTERTIYLTEDVPATANNTVLCSATYEVSTNKINNFSCVWQQNPLATYQKTVATASTTYTSYFGFAKKSLAKTSLTVLSCKKKILWDPRTWFSCVTEVSQKMVIESKIIPVISSSQQLQNSDEQTMVMTHTKIDSVTIKERLYLHLTATIGENTIAYDYFSPEIQRQHTLYYATNNKKAYFSWLFTGPRDVSQWHGNTAFQKPHGGIDFSVANETIIAPAEGKIVSSGYSKQSVCYAGGNYIAIKHPNGLYTYYFHLASTKFTSGKPIKVNASIKRGQSLTKTGNSGMYNCEQLASHLHFELRTTTATTSHVNPVPYFSIDWNTIRTARASTYPGRLTGDNPHPKF